MLKQPNTITGAIYEINREIESKESQFFEKMQTLQTIESVEDQNEAFIYVECLEEVLMELYRLRLNILVRIKSITNS